jgi:hypothetical protein
VAYSRTGKTFILQQTAVSQHPGGRHKNMNIAHPALLTPAARQCGASVVRQTQRSNGVANKYA